MQFKIDFIDKEHVELLRTVYGEKVKVEPSGDGENYNATIQGGTLTLSDSGLYIGGVHFYFADYGNVIIY